MRINFPGHEHDLHILLSVSVRKVLKYGMRKGLLTLTSGLLPRCRSDLGQTGRNDARVYLDDFTCHCVGVCYNYFIYV